MELSIGLLQCSHNIVASFLRNKQSEESKTESVMSSCPNFRSCAPLCLQCLIGYTLVLFNVRRSYTKARRQDSLRPSCRLVLQVFKPKLFNYSWKFFILYQRLVHSFQFVLDRSFLLSFNGHKLCLDFYCLWRSNFHLTALINGFSFREPPASMRRCILYVRGNRKNTFWKLYF